MAIDSKLRGCDLVRMKVVDVMASAQIKERASVLQNKTQKPVRFEISEGTRASVAKWMDDPLMVGSVAWAFSQAASHLNTPICPHRAGLGFIYRFGSDRLWHPFDATHEGHPDL